MRATKALDYYEFLQISPRADNETIHRVCRYLSTRFHPENPYTGDSEKFFVLKQAYDVLSNHERRTEYDGERQREAAVYTPLSESFDFLDQEQGELNRRLAVLAMLYLKRRSNPFDPQVSLAQIERRMGFPRDYLYFTTWYLVDKGYITEADNSNLAVTADGVDFIETQRCKIPVLSKLLTICNLDCAVEEDTELLAPNAACNVDVKEDTELAAPEVACDVAVEEDTEPLAPNAACNVDVKEDTEQMAPEDASMIVLPDMTRIHDRRANPSDRRVGAPDWRIAKIERRKGPRRESE